MKILVVFNHPAPYKVKLFNELSKYCTIDVIFERKANGNRDSDFYNEKTYLFNNINLNIKPLGKENAYGNSLRKYISKHSNKYDHIIMNGYSTFAEMSAIRYLVKNNIPYIFMINGGVVHKENNFKKKIKNYYISHASKYLCPSEESVHYLTYYGADKDKINFYPYSNIFANDIIDSSLPKYIKKQIALKYNVSMDNLFINPCQFIERKNNLKLIEIFAKRQENLVLIGNGPLKKKYLDYIKKNNISNVKLIDFLRPKQLKEIMQISTGLITLSKEDIFGHSVLEALSNGVPVISSKNVLSALDVIKNGTNGFIVDQNNDIDINHAIDNISTLQFNDIVNSVKDKTIEQSAKIIIENLK